MAIAAVLTSTVSASAKEKRSAALECVAQQGRAAVQGGQDPGRFLIDVADQQGRADLQNAAYSLLTRYVCGYGREFNDPNPTYKVCRAEMEAADHALAARLKSGRTVKSMMYEGPGGSWAVPASASDAALINRAKQSGPALLACVEKAWQQEQHALEAAGDPCAQERALLKRLRWGSSDAEDVAHELMHDQEVGGVFDPTLPVRIDAPRVSALWQCEQGASTQQRACIRARADRLFLWERIQRGCKTCTEAAAASETCAAAFDPDSPELTECMRVYKPAQDLERQRCAAASPADLSTPEAPGPAAPAVP